MVSFKGIELDVEPCGGLIQVELVVEENMNVIDFRGLVDTDVNIGWCLCDVVVVVQVLIEISLSLVISMTDQVFVR